MQYFAPLHQSDARAKDKRSLRASQHREDRHRRRNKRKHDEDDEDPISPEDEAQNQPATSNKRPDSLDPEQLRVAGLLPGDAFEIPAPPFPHAPAGFSKERTSNTKLQQDLASLDPPLFAVKATSKHDPVTGDSQRPALREQHLAVLTAILHRCLHEGDYHRAGRAWGMILRSHIDGLPYDVRSNARWGIGAEILLHRNAANDPDRNEDAAGASTRIDKFSAEGFQLAREYYQRLIVQYPYQKQLVRLKRRVDERTFYPAMFSLWIYEIKEKSNRRRQSRAGAGTPDSVLGDADTPRSANDVVEELDEANMLANRLDELIRSPPFDKQADLLQLRGYVGLWLGDLRFASIIGQNQNTSDMDAQMLQQATSTRAAYVQSAQEFFERAQAS